MYFTYFVSVITTIEKLFQIKSKTTGLLLSATEVGQICTSLFLTYFAGRGHRPRWIACGKFVFLLCFLIHVLHIFFFFSFEIEQQQNQIKFTSHVALQNPSIWIDFDFHEFFIYFCD